MPINDGTEEFTFILRFRHAVSAHERCCRVLIDPSSLRGPTYASKIFVHVDVIVHRSSECDANNISVSAFMGEKLALRKLSLADLQDPNYTYVAMKIDKGGYDRYLEFALSLINRSIPYNYSDLALIPFGASEFFDTMFTDVDPNDISSIRTLYCSQFAFICIKHCFPPAASADLLGEIRAMNSRCVGPAALYSIVAPHGQHLDTPMHLITDQRLLG